jgi:hypothetical protein
MCGFDHRKACCLIIEDYILGIFYYLCTLAFGMSLTCFSYLEELNVVYHF